MIVTIEAHCMLMGLMAFRSV